MHYGKTFNATVKNTPIHVMGMLHNGNARSNSLWTKLESWIPLHAGSMSILYTHYALRYVWNLDLIFYTGCSYTHVFVSLGSSVLRQDAVGPHRDAVLATRREETEGPGIRSSAETSCTTNCISSHPARSNPSATYAASPVALFCCEKNFVAKTALHAYLNIYQRLHLFVNTLYPSQWPNTSAEVHVSKLIIGPKFINLALYNYMYNTYWLLYMQM